MIDKEKSAKLDSIRKECDEIISSSTADFKTAYIRSVPFLLYVIDLIVENAMKKFIVAKLTNDGETFYNCIEEKDYIVEAHGEKLGEFEADTFKNMQDKYVSILIENGRTELKSKQENLSLQRVEK